MTYLEYQQQVTKEPMTNPLLSPDIKTIKEAAKLTKKTERQIRWLIDTKKISSGKVGWQTIVSLKEVKDALK